MGPQRGLAFARARRWDGSVELFADHQGKIERALLDNEGLMVSATTRNEPLCAPLCTLLISLGGVLRCDKICSLLGQSSPQASRSPWL